MDNSSNSAWRKSSYSSSGNCVEVAAWHTSSHSGNGTCVEVGTATRIVAVRDTKDRTGPMLRFGSAEWHSFIASVRAGDLDLDRPGRRR